MSLAASLISFHLVLSSVLAGYPVLGKITVVPHFLHLMIDLHGGVSNVLEINFYTSTGHYLSTTRFLFISCIQAMASGVRHVDGSIITFEQ